MNVFMKHFNCKLRRICQRFMHIESKSKEKPEWVKPVGYTTDIKLYNPMTKCKVPLILKNKNVLRWYICGPTVYDSAHLGHATTYVKSDIIRRILSEYFNINVVMVMCITDIDDKIIQCANETGQNIDNLTNHYEKEFFKDMRAMNVTKPHLSCKVTDYIPQIIQFIDNIVSKGSAYIAKDGKPYLCMTQSYIVFSSVYFDTNMHHMYGKLATPFPDSDHPYKKSALDFALWKAAKSGEPFWESPWGKGRPGWHIECSAIASTVFGNCVDIHSGGIDLVFPHHENEEAQSCCYHEVDQWVNYWLHCGHLSLEHDVKMSKSLKNTVSIQEYLQKHTANQFRMLCLLSHYRNGVRFSDTVMNNAVSLLNKVENFLSDCNNYIAGRWDDCNVDEVILLQCLDHTINKVNEALMDDFDTAEAMMSITKLVNLGIKMLHDHNGASKSRSVTAVAIVSNYVSTTFSKFGISNTNPVEDHRMDSIIGCFMKFRTDVRNRAMAQETKDKVLLSACDEARLNLSTLGVLIKDNQKGTTWDIKKY